MGLSMNGNTDEQEITLSESWQSPWLNDGWTNFHINASSNYLDWDVYVRYTTDEQLARENELMNQCYLLIIIGSFTFTVGGVGTLFLGIAYLKERKTW